MRNILVVNVNWLGDVVFSTPVYKSLRRHYPQARLVALGVPRIKTLLSRCPGVDDIIVYDERGQHRSLWGKWQLVRLLRHRKFDAVFLLHGSWTRAVMMWLAGIPVRVGYRRKGRERFLTHTAAPADWSCPRRDVYLRVIEAAGVPVRDRACELSPEDRDRHDVVTLLDGDGVGPGERLIVVNAGGNWDLKRWPLQNFSTLIARLRQDANTKVMIIGGPGDRELAQHIAETSGAPDGTLLIWAGRTSLPHLIALLERADVVVSNDSGPLHIASSVGTKVVGIFGPTRPDVTGPCGTGAQSLLQHDVGCNRAPCYFLKCPNNVCMQAVTVNEVLAAVQALSPVDRS